MNDRFGTARMAAGYARARPPIHEPVVRRICERLGFRGPLERALDIGCGAGLSTKALELLCNHPIGIDPSEAMLHWSQELVPRSRFAAAAGEALPFGPRAMDLITAAGALDWIDAALFFHEVVRVLKPSGTLVIYDVEDGRHSCSSDDLDAWYSGFLRRYPKPPRKPLDVEALEPQRFGLRVDHREPFEVALDLSATFYLDYLMTHSNVEAAVRSGIAEEEIRSWCRPAIAVLFNDRSREVLFRGYIIYLSAD